MNLQAKDRVWREVVAVVLTAVALLIGLALYSHQPEDPGFHHYVATGTYKAIHNRVGLVGAYLSDGLFQIFGLASYLIPAALALLGLRLAFLPGPWLEWQEAAGFSFLLPISSALLHVVVPRSSLAEDGGLVGFQVAVFLVDRMDRTGAILVLVALLFIAFMTTTRLSITRVTQCTAWLFVFLIGKSMSAISTGWNLVFTKMTIRKERKRRSVKSTRSIREVVDGSAASPTIVMSESSPARGKIGIIEQQELPFARAPAQYRLPSIMLLDAPPPSNNRGISREALLAGSRILELKLLDFGVKGKVTQVHPGPIITLYEYEPISGTKINKIANLSDDLALALSALSVRIIAPIPGKGTVGIELPNKEREIVWLREIIASDAFMKCRYPLPLALGKDTTGNPVVVDLSIMPHLLIAGATGTGKSVALNDFIISLLYRCQPDNVRFILVDPKRLELSHYEGIPHLLHPVVTDVRMANRALKWAVREMERRYQLLAALGVRSVGQFNQKVLKGTLHQSLPPPVEAEGSPKTDQAYELEPLPCIVIVIDELADLMMVASREVEESISRLAQMARAAGIHLIMATQRPSVDVITGLIKANFPARISFKVSSRVDSRTILDANGAESLLGAGDMLYQTPGTSKLRRVHGAYITEIETARVVEFIKHQQSPRYEMSVGQEDMDADESNAGGAGEYDAKWDEAVALVARLRQASISLIQRHLRIGYNRAARIIEKMEEEGIVGPSDGTSRREVRISPGPRDEIDA
ncbi:MAG: DNA translocase FtsK 4TM domain-containing protein [Deltaproteobacteria bacterium]|nr:DNA translocase FtsK 4TM domain-containing protein [Deltaproteobacteria bacterium]